MYTQQQKQMTAYQKEVAYKKFQNSIKWLEKFIEIAYGDQFPDWESRKQFREDGIPRKDIIGNPKRTEKLFSFSLYSLEGCSDHPELLEKMKEEFYQWIDATKIDVNNCPEKLKYYLFGFSEILEGRGEKIVAEGDNRQDTFDVDSPEYAKGLNTFFSSFQTPMQEARKRENSLKDKKFNELEIGSNFDGNNERGEKTFQQIRKYVSTSSDYQNFYFFPQKTQQQPRPWEQSGNSASSQSNYPQPTNYSDEMETDEQTSNPQQTHRNFIENIKQNISQWNIRDLTVGHHGKQTFLVHQSVQKNEKGSIILGTEKTLHKDRFNETEWAEIRRVWVNYQYELVLKKLRERKKENWETWEGVEKWRKELEAEIFSRNVDYQKITKAELVIEIERLKAELEVRKTEQNSSNYEVSSQKLEQQLQKAESVLNSFETSENISPKSNSVLPVAIGVVGLVSLFGGLIIWKRKKKR